MAALVILIMFYIAALIMLPSKKQIERLIEIYDEEGE